MNASVEWRANRWACALASCRGLSLALVLFGAVAGCGLAESGYDDASAQQARDYEKLAESYRQIEGVYRGTLDTRDPQFRYAPGTLIVYMVESDLGSNPDGSRKNPPVLRARFRLDKAARDTDDVIMTGDYKKTTGRIVLTSEGSGGAGAGGGAPMALALTTPPVVPPVGAPPAPGSARGGISLRGRLAGERLEDATISRRGGVWGVFQGVRTAREVIAPIGGGSADDRNRLYEIFGAAEGRYSGVVHGRQDFGIELNLYVVLGTEASAMPAYLAGRWDLQGGFPGIGTVHLVGSEFDALTGQIFMQQYSAGGSYSLRGWVRNGHLEAEVRSRDGFLGTLVAERVGR